MKRKLIALVVTAMAASLTLLAFSPIPDEELDDGFLIAGEEDLVWDRVESLSWEQEEDGSSLTVDGATYTVDEQSSNVVKLVSADGNEHYLFRIGSDEYDSMIEYRECVDAGRSDCVNPLEGL